MNRETYLEKGVKALTPLFAKHGYKLPPVKVSCSWPGGHGNKLKAIGQCWPRGASDANINEVFISPSISDSVRALDILTHELIHAIDDCQNGHRKEFSIIMRAVGLAGKPTATHAGERLHAELESIANKLGSYPHEKLNTANKRKQKSRQLKVSCTECGAIWRMSKTWIMQAKACPVCLSEEIEVS